MPWLLAVDIPQIGSTSANGISQDLKSLHSPQSTNMPFFIVNYGVRIAPQDLRRSVFATLSIPRGGYLHEGLPVLSRSMFGYLACPQALA